LRIAGSSLLLQAGVTLGAGQATTGEPKRGAIKTSEAPLGYSLQDVADDAHLDFFQVCGGDKSKKYILETTGSGVAFIDYDNDGWLDIFLVNGGTLRDSAAEAHAGTKPHSNRLFHNNRNGTFSDITDKAGLTHMGWGQGVCVGDYDNDGFDDLFVTYWGEDVLYHNNGDGTFTEVGRKANVAGDPARWSTGCAFVDYDRDGKLDLFVTHYVNFSMQNALDPGTNPYCMFKGLPVNCGPRGLIAETSTLYHNNGDGTFTDVSEKAGVADKPGYYGLGAVFVDINNDGKPDLLVGNDSTPNYLYLNKGDGTFEDVSYASGYALNEAGRETASMGIAVGDYENNGMLDIFNTTFSDDYKPLYHNEGDANLTDISYQLGIAEISVPFLSWGDAFMDYDNDGWKDLLMSDGHVYPEADKYSWGTTWAQRPMLFHNIDGKRFETVPPVEGTGLADVIAGRGMAVGDLFNDGKLDAVINVMDGHPVLLRNVNADKNHWLELNLVGGPKSPSDAVGARVFLTANGMKQREDVISGGSYLSTNDLRPHFGLGQATSVEALEVQWPSGKVEKFTVPGVDRIVTLTEGQGK
jgi:hypothetical protein